VSDAPRLILGTAGHIDHGKTALVRALTGVDCDRLPEEKRRGITIELGFAPLDLPSGLRLGIVDVPGHEKLVRTMVSGATGIDLVLFVVAADEGIMPQTREHLAICELLGVTRGVVALTKVDAVDAELAELARLEVEEELAGSALAGAPLCPVSALRGTGLEALREALDRVAGSADARTPRLGPAWLPIDRAFSMRGFGTVVTGTLRGNTIGTGDAVEVLPEGSRASVAARVRGVQVHGDTAERAEPGMRCALNLHGVELAQVPRGSVVATQGRLAWRPRLGVELRLLEGAPPVAHGAEVTFHIGTSERLARVLLLDGRAALEGGARALAELRFDRPVIALEGDRFIVRGYSRLPGAGWTVGGGRVVDAEPLRGRRARGERLRELAILAGDDRTAALRARLERAGPAGMREADLLREVLSLDRIEAVRVGDRFVAEGPFKALAERTAQAVEAHHKEVPTDAWVGLASVASRTDRRIPDEVLRAALERAVEQGALESSGAGYRRPEHAAHAADPELARSACERLAAQGLAPDDLETLAKALGTMPAALRPVLDHLVREGVLSRVSSTLFFDRAALDGLRSRVVAYLEQHGEIDPAAYKDLTGQTRKFTVPLMEHFDAERLTVRRGNLRVLRAGR
jgi:selenocysteine-specific elongation factor